MKNIQRELARHALGLPNRKKTTYRNHFVTGEGSTDHPHWIGLVKIGAAWRRTGHPLSGGDDVFGMTRAGALAVLDEREKLSAEDFPKEALE
jgi:hypothetical protein